MGTSTLRRSLHTGLAGLVLTVGGLALVAPAAGALADPGAMRSPTHHRNDRS